MTKFTKLASAAVAALMIAATPMIAQAAPALVNLSVTGVDNDQVTVQDINMLNVAGALANGGVDNLSEVTADALGSVNLLSVNTDQNGQWLNGQLTLVDNDQMTQDVVTMTNIAVAAANGGVNHSSVVAAAATGLVNTAIVGNNQK